MVEVVCLTKLLEVFQVKFFPNALSFLEIQIIKIW